MEQQRVHGLVVREMMHGENDKLLVILTKETGRLLVCAKGARSIKNRHFAAVQLFSYSEFVLRARGERFGQYASGCVFPDPPGP